MTTKWTVVLWIAGMLLPALGQSQSPDRFALTAQQVARTLADRGMQVADKQVSLVARVVATEPNPVLDIVSVHPLGAGGSSVHSETRTGVELACRLPGVCLPFYAIVSNLEGTASRVTTSVASSFSDKSLLAESRAQTIMQTGTRATLMMDDDRSHIQVSVITLEKGSIGHSIRVASSDHKHFYVGEVVSARLLKRRF